MTEHARTHERTDTSNYLNRFVVFFRKERYTLDCKMVRIQIKKDKKNVLSILDEYIEEESDKPLLSHSEAENMRRSEHGDFDLTLKLADFEYKCHSRVLSAFPTPGSHTSYLRPSSSHRDPHYPSTPSATPHPLSARLMGNRCSLS